MTDKNVKAMKQAQAAIAKCLSAGGVVLLPNDEPDEWWADIIAAQQQLAKALATQPTPVPKMDEAMRHIRSMENWVTAALECKSWHWDGDQYEAAEFERDAARNFLTGAHR